MKSTIMFACGFILGAAGGAAGALLYLSKDYKNKLNEEIGIGVQKELSKIKDEEAKKEDNESDKTYRVSPKKAVNRMSFEEREASMKTMTDSFGYTNYEGEASLTRNRTPDSHAKNGDSEDDFGSEDDDYDLKKQTNNTKNDEFYAPFLKNKSDACATKSDALDDLVEKIGPKEDYLDAPYGISDKDYLYDKRFYDKETLVFYAEDGVFTDVCATFVDNASLLVGEKWRIEIGKYEENTAYIRNDRMNTDYQIIVENGSFEEAAKISYGEV